MPLIFSDPEETNLAVKKRPYWGPHQVRTLEDVIPGHYYCLVYNNGEREWVREQVLVLTKPEESNGSITFQSASLTEASVQTRNCADLGIVPYASGLWNPKAHLLVTDFPRIYDRILNF